MNINKKNLIVLIIIGILLFGIPAISLCSIYCIASDFDLDSALDGSCPFAFHFFFQVTIAVSAFFMLPLAGLFRVKDRQFIPSGVYWPLFRPPRFSH